MQLLTFINETYNFPKYIFKEPRAQETHYKLQHTPTRSNSKDCKNIVVETKLCQAIHSFIIIHLYVRQDSLEIPNKKI